VHNRTASRCDALVARGAVREETVAALARAAEVVITIVGYPQDVEAVYLAPGGLVAQARPGALLVDMTTSSPALARRIAAAAAERGLCALDAPVSGGERGAREAVLSIMVGGDEAAFERARPILACMGRTIVRQGGPGAGQHTKLANQVAIASGMLAVCEALSYAKGVGLDPGRVLESIGGGAAGSWSMTNLAPKMLAGDMAPGFFVKHFVKDLELALGEAGAHGLDLPGLAAAARLYRGLLASGAGELGTQALIRCFGGT
jgi:3-hydroxyisobutyrate dehydrogenase